MLVAAGSRGLGAVEVHGRHRHHHGGGGVCGGVDDGGDDA